MKITPINNYSNYNSRSVIEPSKSDYVTFKGGYNEMRQALYNAIDRAKEPLNKAEKEYAELLKSLNPQKAKLLKEVAELQNQVRELHDKKLYSEIDGMYKKMDALYKKIEGIDKQKTDAYIHLKLLREAFKKQKQNMLDNPWGYI